MPVRRAQVYLLTAFVIAANVVGNLALSWGMKHPSGFGFFGIEALDALLSPWVLLGIGLLAVWTLARMTLLSWADLSFVLPVTSVGYVINAWIGFLFLHESISNQRWIGTALILTGTIVTATTPHKADPS
jgi:uncharacterized membrane protein